MIDETRKVYGLCESPKTADRKLKPLVRWLGEGEGRVPLWRIEVCDECFEDLIEEGSKA